jgi:hypothetical protein
LSTGQLKLLVDPTKASTLPKGFPSQILGGSDIGLKSDLSAKKAAVTAYMRGMQATLKLMAKMTPTQMAKKLRTISDWQTISLADLTQQVAQALPFNAPDQGQIPASTWSQNVSFLQAGGLSYVSPTDPTWSYKALVDMSYLNDAK